MQTQQADPFQKLSDKELYEKCREIGILTLKYRKQFLGMIPEVEKRKLYLRYGMHDIYEFAAKLAGINHEIVNEFSRIHRLLNNAPILQEKLVSGEIPYTKLRPVAPMVTKENQEIWLKKVETMSRPTLEVYAREMKAQEERQRLENEQRTEQETGQQTGMLPEYRIEHRTGIFPVRCGGLPWKESEYETLSMKVNSQTAAKMRVFKQRLEKKLRKSLDWDETLQEILILAEGRTKIQNAKMQKNTNSVEKTKAVQNNFKVHAEQSSKRYIPAAIRHQVLKKNKGVCDAPGCNKPGEIFHHAERFALRPEHNPETIKYLCKAHEHIAHHSLIKNEEKSPENWRLLAESDKNHPKFLIDSLVQKFRIPLVRPTFSPLR